MTNIYPCQVNSWTILSKNVFIKAMDKSAFLHHGTGIPKKIKSYWGVEDLVHGKEKHIVVKLADITYKMKITCDQLSRTRLFWNADFSSVIALRYNELFDMYKKDDESTLKPEMRFRSTGANQYEVEFIDTVESYELVDQSVESSGVYISNPRNEGRVIYQYSKRYERNSNLRRDAIRLHGLTCMACAFNFGNTYGTWGDGYIEIHHTRALYENEKEVAVDPKHDLVPVCSNCHSMIHKERARVLSVEQVKSLLVHT